MTNHTAATDRIKILKHLELHGSATTLELRHCLDVLSPAPRIFELRHNQNKNIVTTRTVGDNPGGTPHKGIALYTLKSGLYKEIANDA